MHVDQPTKEIWALVIEAMSDRHGRLPPWELFRLYEMESGNFVIKPGQRDWLPRKDWDDTTVVSLDGDEVRILHLIARLSALPGGLKRFQGLLQDHKLLPVYVNPPIDIQHMLRAWGWRFTIAGEPPIVEYRWRPADEKKSKMG